MAEPQIPSSRTRWRGYTLNVLIFVVLVVGIRLWQQRDMVSGAAPVLQGVMLSGQPYVLAREPGKPVLVHFWASWCPICRAEQGSIQALHEQGSAVVSIALQSGSAAEVQRYMREQGIGFPTLNDPDGRIATLWGVHATPASFILSPDGRIRFVEMGYTSGIGLRLRLWLAGL
jgi:peroxiredoxin